MVVVDAVVVIEVVAAGVTSFPLVWFLSLLLFIIIENQAGAPEESQVIVNSIILKFHY